MCGRRRRQDFSGVAASVCGDGSGPGRPACDSGDRLVGAIFRRGGIGLEVRQNHPGPSDDFVREAGEASHVDTVAFIGGASDDFAKKNDLIVPFAHGHVVIFHASARFGERGEFMIVGGKQGPITLNR